MLESPSAQPDDPAEVRPLRVLVIAALAVATVIHGLGILDAETFAVAAFLAASAAGTFAGAVLLLAWAPRSGWLVGGITSLLTLAAYCVSRTVGIPGVDPREGIGNSSEPLGVMSLVVESFVIVLAVVALVNAHRLTVNRAVAGARASIPGAPQEPSAQSGDGRRPPSVGSPDPHRAA